MKLINLFVEKLKCVDVNADADTSISLNIKLFKIDENAYYVGFFRKKVLILTKKYINIKKILYIGSSL